MSTERSAAGARRGRGTGLALALVAGLAVAQAGRIATLPDAAEHARAELAAFGHPVERYAVAGARTSSSFLFLAGRAEVDFTTPDGMRKRVTLRRLPLTGWRLASLADA